MNQDPPEDSPGKDQVPFQDPGAHAPPEDLDFQVVRLIGRGGYGEVWLVRDKAGNYFACKAVYRESFREDRPYEREYDGIQKFEPVSRSSESQVEILHVGRVDAAGYFYYIMELADDVQPGPFAPGTYTPKTLRSELESRRRLPVRECIEIGLSLSDALDNLHRHGLIHRDIKPANIIFVKGVPKLADIGLVTDKDVTVSYVGTEGFIPPEGPKTAQADIYALGKVLYEIATGKDRLEFPELPEDISDLPDRELLLELNAVIIKACETDPRNRYASARDFHKDLALLSAGKSVRKRRASRRRTNLLARAVLALAATAVLGTGIFYLWKTWSNHSHPPAVAGSTLKIPWPAAHDIAETEAKLKDDYQAQLASSPPPIRQQAALELIKRGEASTDPAFTAAALRVAGLLAASAGDVSLAMETCGKIEERFELNVFPQRADLLEEINAHAKNPRSNHDLAQACLIAGFAAMAADDYLSANRVAAVATTASSKAADESLPPQASFLDDQTSRCSEAFDRLANDWKTFHEKPNDPRAALAVGKFLSFIKNDWAAGLPLMARSEDERLKAVASAEINGKSQDALQQHSLGNAWWDLSAKAADDEKIYYQRRARYWYLKALANSQGASADQLKQQLAPRIQAVPTDPGFVHITARVGGTEFVDIYSDEVQWRNSRRETTGNKINHVNLGDFEAGGIDVIQNTGTTWLLPDSVDFSTAQLVVDRIANRQGQATLQIFPDHVRVVLTHARLGLADMEVSIRFGKQP